ncbi:MAG: hypothetical protein PHF84_04030 [bacterium]|nr:hypothetical protein [bacterium]
MKKSLLIILTCLFFTDLGLAKQQARTNVIQYQIKEEQDKSREVAEYLKKREEELNQQNSRFKQESSLRRFEVMFFSSGAMVYWSSLVFVKLFAEIATGYSSELNNTYWYYIGFNALGIATYISIKDYYDIKAEAVTREHGPGNAGSGGYQFRFLSMRF